eukprot:GHVS01107275.1.p1 GENE.GHVS01107275.1~~GHVS01107275.1.p1  ORF type:complete len:300 (+),score=41.36 GHVS01107275.1:269-1168(+)
MEGWNEECVRKGSVVDVYKWKEKQQNDSSGICEVRLSNSSKRNAMGELFWSEFPSAVRWAAALPEVRVILIAAEGSVFTAGIDLTYAAQNLAATDDSQGTDTARRSVRLRAFVKSLQEALSCLEECHVPVIAVVCGKCIGAGVDLISACDMRVASLSTAHFSVKEVDVGLAADLGTLQRLQKIVGNDSWVREVCYTAREFAAAEAMDVGLLSYAEHNDAATRQKAWSIAKSIASKSPVAISGTKFALNYSRNRHTSDGLAMQAIWNSAMLQTNDIMTAVASASSNPSTSAHNTKRFANL